MMGREKTMLEYRGKVNDEGTERKGKIGLFLYAS